MTSKSTENLHEFGAYADRIGHWSDGPETFVVVKAKDVQVGSQTYGPPQVATPAAAVSLQLAAEIWTCQGEIDACRDDGMLGAFDTDHTQGNDHFDIGFVRLETAATRESALIAEVEKLRASIAAIHWSLRQTVINQQTIKILIEECEFAVPELRTLSAPAVEGE